MALFFSGYFLNLIVPILEMGARRSTKPLIPLELEG